MLNVPVVGVGGRQGHPVRSRKMEFEPLRTTNDTVSGISRAAQYGGPGWVHKLNIYYIAI